MKCDLDTFLTWHFSLPVSCVDFLCMVCLTQSSLLLKWLQPVHIICFFCLCSANVTFMRLSGLVAEAEQTVWCRSGSDLTKHTGALYYKHQWEEAEHRRAPGVFTENTRAWGWWRFAPGTIGHYTPLLGSPPARFRRSLCFQIFIWHHIFGSNDVSDNEDTFFGYILYIFSFWHYLFGRKLKSV